MTTPRAPDLEHPGDSPSVVRGRLLIVDDEPSLANTLGILLGDRYDVVKATSGKEALALLEGGLEIDVILCDLMMPTTSGMDVHARLAAVRPGLEQKMIFMTGGTFTPRAAAFVASVPNSTVEKPFSVDAVAPLLDAIAHR